MKFLTFFITTLALSAVAVHAEHSANGPPIPNGTSLIKNAKHRLGKKKAKVVVETAKEAPKATTEKGGN